MDQFVASISTATVQAEREQLEHYVAWARSLEAAGLARLFNSIGKERWTLLPRLVGYDAGLVTLWNDHGSAYVSAYRTVFQRMAPKTLERLEARFGQIVGSGNTIRKPAFSVLEPFFTDAYREGRGVVSTEQPASTGTSRDVGGDPTELTLRLRDAPTDNVRSN